MKKWTLILLCLTINSLCQARPYDRSNDWPRDEYTDEEVECHCREQSADWNMDFWYEWDEETSWPTNNESSFYDMLTR